MGQQQHLDEYGTELHAHHKIPIVDCDDDPHRVENLVILCCDCHNEYEKMAPLCPQ
jgi:5-methylcytosine-specific restriction endonuclease McrA